MFRSLSFPMKNRKHLFLSLTKISLYFPSLNSLENYPWVAERPRPQIAITNTNTKVESPQSLRMTTLPSIVAPIRILRNSKENSNSLLTRHSLPFCPCPSGSGSGSGNLHIHLGRPSFPSDRYIHIYVHICICMYATAWRHANVCGCAPADKLTSLHFLYVYVCTFSGLLPLGHATAEQRRAVTLPPAAHRPFCYLRAYNSPP